MFDIFELILVFAALAWFAIDSIVRTHDALIAGKRYFFKVYLIIGMITAFTFGVFVIRQLEFMHWI